MTLTRRATDLLSTRRASQRDESHPHRVREGHPQLFGQTPSDWHPLSNLPRQPPHRRSGLLLTPASMRMSDPHGSETDGCRSRHHGPSTRAVIAPAQANVARAERHDQLDPPSSGSCPRQDCAKLRSTALASARGLPEPEQATSKPLLGICIELLQSLVECPIDHPLRPAQALLCVGDANAELLGRLRSCKPLLQA